MVAAAVAVVVMVAAAVAVRTLGGRLVEQLGLKPRNLPSHSPQLEQLLLRSSRCCMSLPRKLLEVWPGRHAVGRHRLSLFL